MVHQPQQHRSASFLLITYFFTVFTVLPTSLIAEDLVQIARDPEERPVEEIHIGDQSELIQFFYQSEILTARGEHFLRFIHAVSSEQLENGGRINISIAVQDQTQHPHLIHPLGYIAAMDFILLSGVESHDIDSPLFDSPDAFSGSFSSDSDETNMSGICGVISTAYSLVFNLGCIDKKDAIEDGKQEWRDDFLKDLKNLTDDPSKGGATSDDIADMHRRHPKLTCKVDCDDDDEVLEDGDDIESFCLKLYERVSAGADCPVGFYSSDTERGHSIYISLAIDVGNGKCAFFAANTAKQGHRGKDVPLHPPLTRTLVSPNDDGGIDVHFDKSVPGKGWEPYTVLNSAKFDLMDYRCCEKSQ